MASSSGSKYSLLGALVRGLLFGMLLLGVFMAGFFLRDGLTSIAPAAALADPPRNYDLLLEVQSLLDTHYVRELPEQSELEYAAIRGVLGLLNDPYTFFNPPAVTQSESDVLAGQYGGIGIQVQHADDGSFVLYPFPDGPAAQAGIQDGDILVAVADWIIEPGTQMDEIRQAMRGEVGNGNGVSLVLRDRTSGEQNEYFVEFAVIEVPSVVWRTLVEDTRIGYVQILRFTSRTPDELAEALQELLDLNIQGWILDVRDNAGGLLQEAIEVADAFLDDGVIAYEAMRDSEHEYRAQPGGAGTTLPMVVLVNGGTASAAELVAGALQDLGRAVVIGQTTYGKGSVQFIFPLVDGSSVHITSALWYTPNRNQLEHNGLTPDIPMIPAEDGRDVEMGEAIRHLRQGFE
ncbi:MAG: S41 family peptidase [Anaerolineae bacterium]|nr:S41 family peptidase [Anaerolineae bacterium]